MTDDDLRRLFESHSAEIRRHFDVNTEGVKREVSLLAEGLTPFVQKLDTSIGRLDKKIDATAIETQAAVKFSHSELERRMREIEDRLRGS